MTTRSRFLVPVAAVFVLAVAALLIRARLLPRPTVGEMAGLAASGRLEEAAKGLGVILEGEPDDPGANLLAAQLAMARAPRVTDSGLGPDPGPAKSALAYLARVESPDAKLKALARLWRGKAERSLGLLDESEASWLEAIRLDPAVPEAGWLLLQEYYLQLRPEEARALALRLHAGEPDPRDRVLLLMEPFRQDVMPPAPASLVAWFEPIAGRQPAGLRANLALGLALVRSSDLERGIDLLRKVAEAHPGRPEARAGLMVGLDEAGEVEELARALGSLPAGFSAMPWTFPYRARVAEARADWRSAADDYRRAIQASPADPRLAYRLARTLRRLGEHAEADRLDARHRDREAMNREARDLYESGLAPLAPGVLPPPDLQRKIADLRGRMGFAEEAGAWRQLLGARISRR